MRNFTTITNRSELGAGTQGSGLGVDAIQMAAQTAGCQFFDHCKKVSVRTDHEQHCYESEIESASKIFQIREQCERVASATQSALDRNEFPLVLSGDHSSALGTISGVKAHFKDQRVGVVWIDAHADIHSPFTTPSGNMHGMPLAAAMGIDNRANQINDVSDRIAREWNRMKNIGVPGAKLDAGDLVYFGVRDTEPAENELRRALALKNYMVHQVRERGLDLVMDETIARLSGCDAIYVSFDVDSLDCNLVSHGTGTPVPNGFTQQEVTRILKRLFATNKVACLEVTEINPLLDEHGNRMAETAFQILRQSTHEFGRTLPIASRWPAGEGVPVQHFRTPSTAMASMPFAGNDPR